MFDFKDVKLKKMLKNAEKAAQRNNSVLHLGNVVIYQVESDDLMYKLQSRGCYGCAFTPKQTGFFRKNPKMKKSYIILEEGLPDYVARAFNAHELGHIICGHSGSDRLFKEEIEADRIMKQICGKLGAISALQYIQNTKPILSYGWAELIARQIMLAIKK